MAKITTTGDLREFLASAINSVANGTMDTDKARNITKLAAQVNESFYAEIKIMKVHVEIGKEYEALGQLPISATSND